MSIRRHEGAEPATSGALEEAPKGRTPSKGESRAWRLDGFSIVASVFAIVGMLTLLYPNIASWITQYEQSRIVSEYGRRVAAVGSEKEAQLQRAREYNEGLRVGAVLEGNESIPKAEGESEGTGGDYHSILSLDDSGLMGRIRIPSIELDLPIYHGTDDQTLLEGIGHLEGTSLPVGGSDTRTVLTGHRGLAQARMFTDLDAVEIGEVFTLEVFGEVLAYRVSEKKIVEPEATESLQAVPGKDLATLVTCTPIGINTHRILLTGERIALPPAEGSPAPFSAPTVPGFPWWALGLAATIIAVGLYIRWAGSPRSPRRARAR